MPGWGMFFGWLLAAVGIACASPVAAQTGLVGRPIAVCVSPVRSGDSPAAMMKAAARFDCSRKQIDYGSGDFWVRSEPIFERDAHAIRWNSLWQRSAALWTQHANGTISHRALDGHALTRAIQLGAIIEVPLDTRSAPATRLLWRIDGATNIRGIVLAPRLATPEESRRSNLVLAALYGAFGGLCLALFVYNLALWTAQRHRFQLAYCLMLIALGTYAFSSSGALAWAFPAIANNTRLKINYISLAGSAITAIAFARAFFEPRIFRGWLSAVTTSVAAFIAITGLLMVFAAEYQVKIADRVHAASFLLATLLTIPILLQAWRRESKFLWLFACAWAAPIALAAGRIAGNFQLVAWSFLLDNSTLAAMAMEALLSSLAIAYRTRLLTRERDEAREQEIVARQLADCDPLTGLLNRRAFLRDAIGASGDRQLIIVDIDHFKSVNDTLGHDGGDEVLRVIARVLRRWSSDGTLVARLGGEEFGLLSTPGTTIALDHILDAIRAERMPFDLRVTASLGAAYGPLADEIDWKSLYHKADQALFAAKAAGRDRSRTSGSEPIAA